MVPIDGPVRAVSGCSARRASRSRGRSTGTPGWRRARAAPPRVAAKNRHNLVCIAAFLLTRWLCITLLCCCPGPPDLHSQFGAPAVAPRHRGLLLSFGWFLLVDRAGAARARARRAARSTTAASGATSATGRSRRPYVQPSTAPRSRPRSGGRSASTDRPRVFDDGCFLTERSFTTIGDGCTLNAGSVVQCHSQEDGAFKSDRSLSARASRSGSMPSSITACPSATAPCSNRTPS